MTDAIAVDALRFAYPRLAGDQAAPPVFDGLDLKVAEGEWLAVMGASDSGKTTLCLLLSGLAPHLTGGTMEGRVVVAGLDTRRHPPPALAETVGVLFQEPEAQLFNPTVEAEVAWGLENLGLPVTEIRARVDQMLALLRLEPLRSHPPAALSGGQKKRLALASVLAMRPAVLILDEPMGGLDPTGRDEVLTALADLRRDRSTTIVMTESDAESVAAFADRLVVLDRGRIALQGTPRALFQRVDPLAALGVAVPDMARLAVALNEWLGTAFRFVTVEEAQAALAAWLGGRPDRLGSRENGREEWPASMSHGDEALRVEGLEFWYTPGTPVLRGVNLSVPAGQFLAVAGANGSGKTTLVKHLNGLLRPRRGQVRVQGQDAANRPVGALARQVGFLFQHPEQQLFSATVREEVAFGPRNLGLPPGEVSSRVEAALARFGLVGVADSPPAILSYGRRRQITLATLAAMDPPILVLDEPTVGLDARGRAEMTLWLRELHGKGRTIVLVTHDMALVADLAERMVVLDTGRIIADGPPAEVFQQSDLLSRASLSPPPVIALGQALRPFGLRGDGLSLTELQRDIAAGAGHPP